MSSTAIPPPPHQPKVVRIGPYRLGKTLGIGSFCKVKLGIHEITGIKVAIKILNRKKLKKQDMGDKFRTEIHILRLFSHINIIRLYEVIDEVENIFCVMEYVENGELFDYIVSRGKLDEKTARSIFQQIISALEYCHYHNVIHRDLKPENILLNENNQIKLVDFGLSAKLIDGQFLKTSCGSPNYAAPEVISGNLYCGSEIDIWSCGVILYALLCGSLPFDDENIRNLFKKIKNGIYSIPPYVSPGARDIISKMLVVDPLKRITIQQIMNHSWYRINLPRHLALTAEQQIEQEVRIDDNIVKRVETMGFQRDKILRALSMGVELTTSRSMAHHTELRKIAVIYNLLRDQQRKKEAIVVDDNNNNNNNSIDHIRESGFNSSEVEQNEAAMSKPALQTHRAINKLQELQQHNLQLIQQQLSNNNNNNCNNNNQQNNNNMYNNAAAAYDLYMNQSLHSSVQLAAGRWRLGRIYRDDPQRIMNALYVTLKKFNFEWKVLSLYRVKARYPAGLIGQDGRTVPGSEVVKFAFQLYRCPTQHAQQQSSNNPSHDQYNNTQPSQPSSAISSPLFGTYNTTQQIQITHLLDIHKLYGQMFLFLELANHILTELNIHLM